MPTTGWSSCGARHARCSRACSTSAGAARSSRAPSATSWCAPAWPAWSSSTSGTRRSTSGASTACPSPGDPASTDPLLGRVVPHRPPRRLGPGPRAAGRRLAGAGGRALLPGHRASTPRAWPAAATWPCGAGAVLGLEDEYFVDPDGRPARLRRPGRRRAVSDGDGRGAPALRRAWCSAARARCCPPSARPGPATWATSSAPSSASRTRSSARRCPGSSSSRAARAPGKTAVALHRAAYLLYTHRFPLERQGVLVVGPEPAVPALHRAGPALAGRDRGQPVDGGGPGARGPGARGRRPRRGQAEGRRAHGQGAGPGRAHPPAPAAPRRRGPLRGRGAAPAGPADRGDRRPWPGAAPGRTTPGGASWRRRCCARWPTSTGPGSAAAASTARDEAPTPGGAERPGPAAAPGPRGGRGARPHVAPPVAARVPARPARRPAAAGRRRQGDPRARRRCSACTGRAARRSTRCRGRSADAALIDEARTLLGPRRGGRPDPDPGAARRGGHGVRGGVLAAGPGGVARRRRPSPCDGCRGRDPLLRPHRGRRGAGPLAHAAAHAGPPLALGLHDRGRRHRPGHRALGPRELGRHHPPPEPAAPAPPGRADRELPHPGRGRGAGRPGPGRGRARHHPAAPGAPVGLPAADRRRRSRAGLGTAAGRAWPARRWRRWPRAGWPSSARRSCCPS